MSKLRSINDNVLVEAIVAGKTALEAGKLAGYNIDRVKEKSIKEMVSRKINQNQNIKRTLIQKLEEKQNKILDSIRQEEIESAGLSQKAVAFGIFRDKAKLLRGDPTENIANISKFIIEQIDENKTDNKNTDSQK